MLKLRFFPIGDKNAYNAFNISLSSAYSRLSAQITTYFGLVLTCLDFWASLWW